MYTLVITARNSSSIFISKGLKYENIQCDPKAFRDDWDNTYTLHQYDCIICKIDNKDEVDENLVDKLNVVSKEKMLFIITDNILDNFYEKSQDNVFLYNKGIHFRQLAMEIKKQLNSKRTNNDPAQLEIADLKLDFHTRTARRFHKNYYLRNKEFQLLEFLMRHPNQVLTRQQILESVWDRNASIFTNTVDVHINTLRKKIDNKSDKRIIETVHSIGYILHSNKKENNPE